MNMYPLYSYIEVYFSSMLRCLRENTEILAEQPGCAPVLLLPINRKLMTSLTYQRNNYFRYYLFCVTYAVEDPYVIVRGGER